MTNEGKRTMDEHTEPIQQEQTAASEVPEKKKITLNRLSDDLTQRLEKFLEACRNLWTSVTQAQLAEKASVFFETKVTQNNVAYLAKRHGWKIGKMYAVRPAKPKTTGNPQGCDSGVATQLNALRADVSRLELCSNNALELIEKKQDDAYAAFNAQLTTRFSSMRISIHDLEDKIDKVADALAGHESKFHGPAVVVEQLLNKFMADVSEAAALCRTDLPETKANS